MTSYFERVDGARYRATEHVSGAWDAGEQHVAPALGLLAHAVEQDRDARRDDALQVARLSYDILGTLPIDVVDIDARVVRAGRTIELVEARLGHAGRTAILLRAWLMRTYDTSAFAAAPLPGIDPPDGMDPWDMTGVWPGGFIASLEVRRAQTEPGRAVAWVRSRVPLVVGETVSPTSRAIGFFDVANGLTPRVATSAAAFPNLDLTAHLFAPPSGDWVGFDTTVSFGSAGLGLTHSVIHDLAGPVGTVSQSLTVRPR